MAKTELKLKTKNAATGQAITTTVGYVNPTADSNTLKTFGQKLNAFTTNTYIETDRVQTINVDTEQVSTKTEPTLAIAPNTKASISENNILIPIANILFNGEPLDTSIINNERSRLWGTVTVSTQGMFFMCGEYNGTDQIVFTFPEGTTPQAKTYNFRIAIKPYDTTKYTPTILQTSLAAE